jgi:hypothetical protein
MHGVIIKPSALDPNIFLFDIVKEWWARERPQIPTNPTNGLPFEP